MKVNEAKTFLFYEIHKQKPQPHSEFNFIVCDEDSNTNQETFSDLEDAFASRSVKDKFDQLFSEGYKEVR